MRLTYWPKSTVLLPVDHFAQDTMGRSAVGIKCIDNSQYGMLLFLSGGQDMARGKQFPEGRHIQNISLSKDIAEELRRAALKERTTASEIVRKSLRAYFLAS